jgi:putative DNA primase/helicase
LTILHEDTRESNNNPPPLTGAHFNALEQRQRRKIAREVAQMYDDIARAAGLRPAERQTSWAISCRRWERDDQPSTQPCRVSLASIGSSLTKTSDNEGARIKRAANRASRLFRQAIPRTGYQILTRYKAAEDSGLAHGYVDHLTPVAAFFSELLAEEIAKICRDRTLDKPGRGAAIAAARQRLVAEALTYLPKCDAEILDPVQTTYEYVSTPEAVAFCKLNPEYSYRPFTYTPPSEQGPPGPLTNEDIKRIEESLEAFVNSKLDAMLGRNSPDESRDLAARLRATCAKATLSWTKVNLAASRLAQRAKFQQQLLDYAAGNDVSKAVNFERDQEEEERQRELIHVSEMGGVQENSDVSDRTEFFEDSEAMTPPKTGGVSICNPLESGDLEVPDFSLIKNDPLEDALAQAPIQTDPVNFDDSLEAAIFYARDGWPVLPICNFNSQTGRCTASWHKPDKDGNHCTGKKPLVKGKGKPGEGYTAATRDLGQIRKWWGGEFRDAGVGIRLDDHALIDCDLKDGGPESYEFLADTFDLPETLTAITQSGGRHYVFRLPDDLPADWLRSWTRVADKIALPGIDLKVAKCGLLYAEPTIGSKGVYRWIDPTVEPATLPRAACDFLHEIRYKDDKPKPEKTRTARVYSSSDWPQEPGEVDPDQAKYFRDVREGESRHKRLFAIGCKIRSATRADAGKIAAAMRYHAARFSEPLKDEAYILRTAKAIEKSFGG